MDDLIYELLREIKIAKILGRSILIGINLLKILDYSIDTYPVEIIVKKSMPILEECQKHIEYMIGDLNA